MKRIFVFALSIMHAVLFSLSCSDNNNPLNSNDTKEKFLGNLEIKTEKIEYKLDEITSEGSIFIQASLTNTSPDTFYTKLGDAYNASVGQKDLRIGKFTDGYFQEKISAYEWNNLTLAMPIEGSKFIRLLPSEKYVLHAMAYLEDDMNGKFRLKIDYYNSVEAEKNEMLTDVSNIFFITAD